MKKRLLIFCFALFLFSSCRVFLYRVFFSVKTPRQKTEKQIINYLDRKHISTENLYGVTTKNYQRELESSKSKEPLFQAIRLYNKDGFKVIPYKSDSVLFCVGRIGDYIGALKDSTIYEIDSTQSIYNDSLLTGGITNLTGKEVPLFKVKNYDFTLVVYWTIFWGKISLDDLKLENNAKKNEPKLKIQVIKINMDPRDYMIKEGFDMKNFPKYHSEN